MKKQIWKFDFSTTDNFELNLPKGAEILTVQTQHGRGRIWAICDTETKETELRKFAIAGTGNPFDFTGKKYIGTYQEHEGRLVWHLFEII